jgi:septum formation topological specificity factor MinE
MLNRKLEFVEAGGGIVKDLLAEIAKHLVDDPDQVTVKEIVSSKTIVLKLAVAKQDVDFPQKSRHG